MATEQSRYLTNARPPFIAGTRTAAPSVRQKKPERFGQLGAAAGQEPSCGIEPNSTASWRGGNGGSVDAKTRSGAPRFEEPEHDSQEVRREKTQQPPASAEPLPGSVPHGRRRSISQSLSPGPMEGQGPREEVGKPEDDQASLLRQDRRRGLRVVDGGAQGDPKSPSVTRQELLFARYSHTVLKDKAALRELSADKVNDWKSHLRCWRARKSAEI
jgi:hypothetical protein